MSSAWPLAPNQLSFRHAHHESDNNGHAGQDHVSKHKNNKPVDFSHSNGNSDGGVESEVDGLIEILIHH